MILRDVDKSHSKKPKIKWGPVTSCQYRKWNDRNVRFRAIIRKPNKMWEIACNDGHKYWDETVSEDKILNKSHRINYTEYLHG